MRSKATDVGRRWRMVAVAPRGGARCSEVTVTVGKGPSEPGKNALPGLAGSQFTLVRAESA